MESEEEERLAQKRSRAAGMQGPKANRQAAQAQASKAVRAIYSTREVVRVGRSYFGLQT